MPQTTASASSFPAAVAAATQTHTYGQAASISTAPSTCSPSTHTSPACALPASTHTAAAQRHCLAVPCGSPGLRFWR